jgi:MarR family transcriptional regulator, organic hydroperoxide resistance regulator
MGRQRECDFQSAFWEAKRALALASMMAFSRHGIHEGQQYVLSCLWEEDGLAPGEVARRLGIATPTVNRAATRMETAGILRREPHPNDKRLVRLVLTERGRRLRGAVEREMAALDELALAGFSTGERDAVLTALERIRTNLVTTQRFRRA